MKADLLCLSLLQFRLRRRREGAYLNGRHNVVDHLLDHCESSLCSFKLWLALAIALCQEARRLLDEQVNV